MAYKTTASSQSVQDRWQNSLASACQEYMYPAPSYQLVSDRRGGRTAWSCTVTVNGTPITARFWYDGKYTNNAKEDAAERALNWLVNGETSPSTSRGGW